MDEICTKLMVYFEEPFWVGIYERVSDSGLEVGRIVFGAEPKDYQVYEYFLLNWNKLKFSPKVDFEVVKLQKRNPKVLQRAIKKEQNRTGIGTKAQQALKAMQEERKTTKKSNRAKRNEDEKEQQFKLRQIKKKKKHKGR